MTLLMLEGFDDYGNGTVWPRISNGPTNSTVTTTGGARTGAGYWTIQNGGHHIIPAAQEHAKLAIGFGFRFSGAKNNDITGFRGDAHATEHIVLRQTASGDVAVDRGATQLAITTVGNVVTPNVWHYVELEALLSDTVGTVKVWVDGVLHIDLSGIDTKNGGTDTVFDSFTVSSSLMQWDDFYLCNGAGSLNVGRMGEIRVETKYMDGNGNYSQLLGSDGNSTDNYLLVDETGAPVTTDYNGSATDGQKDTYTVEDMTAASGTVYGVEVRMHAAKSDAGAKSIRHVHRRATVDSVGPDHVLATSYATYYDILEQDPNGPTAWTVTNFNASEFGAEVRP